MRRQRSQRDEALRFPSTLHLPADAEVVVRLFSDDGLPDGSHLYLGINTANGTTWQECATWPVSGTTHGQTRFVNVEGWYSLLARVVQGQAESFVPLAWAHATTDDS